ncbi:MAG: hypothetical protein AB7R77_12780, partial [Ilumatobacteraceae bacterium]
MDKNQIPLFDPPHGGGIPRHPLLDQPSMDIDTLRVLEQLNRRLIVTKARTKKEKDVWTSKWTAPALRRELGGLVDRKKLEQAIMILLRLGLIVETRILGDAATRYKINKAGKAEISRMRGIVGADTDD